jgi:mannan endo-1,4-beta-mannosidase
MVEERLLKKRTMFITSLLIFVLLATGSALADSTYLENGQVVEEFSSRPLADRKEIRSLGTGCNRYVDHAQGFSLSYPQEMKVDVSLSSIRTVLSDSATRLEIYHDTFSSANAPTAQAYINYSNRFLLNKTDHQVQEDRYLIINGYQVHLLRWERNKLARVENDHNYYVSAEIIVNPTELYTLIWESTRPINEYMTVLESFQTIPRSGSPGFWVKYAPTQTNWNDETRTWFDQYFQESAPLTWGIFEPTAPVSFSYLQQLEKRFNYQFPILLVYQHLDSNPPLPILQQAYKEGRTVELTLQTSSAKLSEADNQRLPYDFLNGIYDDFLHNYARQLKEFGHPVLFRLNNEMNGDWCTYSSYYTSKDPNLFIALWRYVYDIFQQEEVDNVIWVWNPNDISFPDFKWNHAFLYYPGDEYVDVVGLTGYNTGTYYAGEQWREFAYIYDSMYRLYGSVFKHPFMITEFGCNSVGGDKAAWIDNMFAAIKQYPRIKAAIWWSGTDWDSQNRPARIYRIDENNQVLDAFTRGLTEYQPKSVSAGAQGGEEDNVSD